MKKIDCLGEICPIPIILLQKEKANIKNGETILLVTDHSCTLSAVADFCKNHHFSMYSDEMMPGVWEITISNK